MNKKSIIAIVLFIFISLSVYTFANPNREEEQKPNNNNQSTDIIDDENTDDLTDNEDDNERENTRENENRVPSYISLIDMTPASINVTYISNEGKEVKYNRLDERVAIRFISSERLDTSKTIVTIASQNARLESSKALFGNQYEYVYSIRVTDETTEGVIEFYIKAVDTNDNESSIQRFTEKDYTSYKGKIIIDKTAPEIELKGEENVILEYLLDTYTEENAVVTDNIDETREIGPDSITYSFDGNTYEEVPNVDTSKIGIYKLVYTSEDNATHKTVDKNNHESNFVQRTVIVQDTKAANVDILEISNDSKLINFNKLGDKIFVKFQTNEELDEEDTVVKIAGQNASLEDKTPITEGGLKYIYTYSIYVNEETPEGEVAFSIKAVDKSDNITDEIFFVEKEYEEYNAKIKVDKTKPTVSVNINRRALYIENGSRVNKNQAPEFRAADTNLEGVKIFDSTGKVKAEVSGLNVTYRYGNFAHLGNGTYTIVSYDKAGNASDEFIVTMDNVKPELEEVKLTGESLNGYVNAGKKVTLTFKGNETLKNTPVVEILGRTFDTLNDEYKYDETTGKYNVTFEVTNGMTNGNVTFAINYKDLASNEGLTVTSTTDSSKVIVDTIKPTVSVNINKRALYIENGSRVNKNQAPEFKAADTNLEGVKIFDSTGKVKAEVSGLNVAYRYGKFAHLGNGTYTIVSYDKAGNASDEFIVTMDNVKPELEEVKLTGESLNGYVRTGKKVTLTFKGNETLKNVPVVEILGRTFDTLNDEYKYDETTGKYNVTFEVTNGMTNGNVTFAINYKDLASNEGLTVTSTTDSSSLSVDTIEPVITIGSYSTLPTNESITVTATTNEGVLNTGSHEFTENGSFTFTATDLAGNISEETVTITNIDKIAALSSISYTNEDKIIFHQDYESDANKKRSSLEKIKFTFTYSDSNSGLNSVKYKNGIRDVSYFKSNGSTTIDLVENPNSFEIDKKQDSYTLYTEDNAGNQNVVTKTVTNIFKGGQTATIGNLKITVSGKYVDWFVNYRDITVETLDGSPIIGYGHEYSNTKYATDLDIDNINYGNKKTWKLNRHESQYHTVHVKDSNGRIYKVWIEIDGII